MSAGQPARPEVAARVAISIVVPTRDRAPLLARQLTALAEQEWDGSWEVVVADNGCTDDTLASLQRFANFLPSLRVVDASAVRGPAHARNVGASVARGEWLIFVDDDDEVCPGWLAAMAAALERHDFVACATELERLNPTAVQRARNNPQGTSLIQGWYPPHLSFAGGCGLGVRRTLHDRVGGFDESLRATEDNDYCYRIQLTTGVPLHFVHDAVVSKRCATERRRMMRQAAAWSSHHVLLHKRHRRAGERVPRPWRRHAAHWRGWVRSLPAARHGAVERARLLWTFGWLVGQLWGSVRHRSPPVPF